MDFEAQFLYACKNGYTDRATRLLEAYEYNETLLKWVVEQGHTLVLKVLLKDKRVDPGIDNQYCIQVASEIGNLEMVGVLLADTRVDPSAEFSISLWLACQNGHYRVVKRLVEDGRVDIKTRIEDLSPLEIALVNDHDKVAYYMLKQESDLEKKDAKDSNGDTMEKVKERTNRMSMDKRTRKLSRVSTTGTPVVQSLPLPIEGSPNVDVLKEIPEGNAATPLEAANPTPKENTNAQERLFKLLKERKAIPLREFIQRYKDIDIQMDQELFNRVLKVLAEDYEGVRVKGRGTCFDFVELVLSITTTSGTSTTRLQIHEYVIQEFRKKFRVRKSPVSLLQKFS